MSSTKVIERGKITGKEDQLGLMVLFPTERRKNGKRTVYEIIFRYSDRLEETMREFYRLLSNWMPYVKDTVSSRMMLFDIKSGTFRKARFQLDGNLYDELFSEQPLDELDKEQFWWRSEGGLKQNNSDVTINLCGFEYIINKV